VALGGEACEGELRHGWY